MKKLKRQIYKYLPFLKPASLFFLIVVFIFLGRLIFPWVKKIIGRAVSGPKLAYSLLTADTSSLQSVNNRTNLLILGNSKSGCL